MRIVLVNWAKIWDGASHGGGVNGYCQSLALSLQDRGHEVVSLSGGTTLVPEEPACTVRQHNDWLGMGVFEVINSPVLAPSIVQFQDPLGEIESPELEDAIRRFFTQLRPDVVHFHNVEGFTAGCVRVAREAGAAVLFSLHNYHTICPQVYLMQGHRHPCTDFRNGHACTTCIETNDTATERQLRIDKLREADESRPELELVDARARFKDEFRWPIRVARAARRFIRAVSAAKHARQADTSRLPGRPTDSIAPFPIDGTDTRGQTEHVVAERKTTTHDRAAQDGHKPLLNVIQPEPSCDLAPNDYGRRRDAMVAMLNGCDRVLPVSDFVRNKFESLGVDPAVIQTLHIGTRITSIVDRARELAFAPPPFDPAHPRPVRLIFLGYNHHYKGLSMFYDALEMLEPDVLAQIDLSIYALDGESIEWLFRRLEPRLARLNFGLGYQYQDIPWMMGGRDLTVVCSVWWDNAPQTVFESMACGVPVLGAELGGIPDFVKDDVNGLLFRGNDREDLARRLREIVADPTRLDRLRTNVRPPKSIEAHADEMERLYQQCRDARSPVVTLGSSQSPALH